MREELVCLEPDGEVRMQPTLAYFQGLLTRGSVYWALGSATLGWVQLRESDYTLLGSKPSLHLLVAAPDLVHLAYRGPADLFLAIYYPSPSALPPVVVTLGGTEFTFPAESFMPRAGALRVCQDFLSDGKPSRLVRWREFRERGDGVYQYVL